MTDNSESTPYTWTTYPERLQAARISWRVYQQAQPGSPLYENGMRRLSASAFADDVAAGKLPQVSWIIAPTAQSEHPGYAPGPGADFCSAILQALFAHPKVWAKTVLFLTYDEPGGYFDHVVPAAAAGRDVRRVRRGRADRPGLSGPDDRVLALESRRVRVLGHLRPHLDAAIPRAAVRHP